ncbi:MAG: thiamine phosphate synthase, partial [Deltaproteobacteria bacterium]|nr:thiamine phosphate synthase [Deltaproteobacteria bacterium]
MTQRLDDDFGLYGILTNPLLGYEKLAEIMVDAGIRIIQLRMKDVDDETVLKTAVKLRKLIPADVLFIINDNPHIAKDVNADGVHLGQADMTFNEARNIVGPHKVIGLSTHNPLQTVEACSLNPDYIGVGPVFPTPTKKNPDPVIGFDVMKKMLDLSTVPAVCLGGIEHSNVNDVLSHGARNICAVRCINSSENPEIEIKKMQEAIRRF